MSDKTIEVDATIERETDNALLIYSEVTDEVVWIPLSQVSHIVRRPKGASTITMTEWLAKKIGLWEG